MQWSLFFLAASAASGSVLKPRATFATNLPASAFPTFAPVPIDVFLQNLDLNKTVTEVIDVFSTLKEDSSKQLASVEVSSKAAAATCSNPDIRVEWKNYPTADRLAFIAAIKCLMNKPSAGTKWAPSKSRYEDFVRLHQWYMPNVHNNNVFLVWHRYYLWVFEQTLKKECGLKKPMPWWDEAAAAGRFSQQDLFTDTRYFGHLVVNPDGSPHCVSSGAFSNLVCNIGPGSGSTPHCLSRALNGQNTAQVTQSFVDTCNSRSSYADMERCSETGPHAYGHNGIGGVMSDVSASPSDPVFWMHHSFVDHSFRIWQNMGGTPRQTTIDGTDVNGNALSMNYVMGVSGIEGFPNVKIGDIMNTMSGTTLGGYKYCYRYDR